MKSFLFHRVVLVKPIAVAIATSIVLSSLNLPLWADGTTSNTQIVTSAGGDTSVPQVRAIGTPTYIPVLNAGAEQNGNNVSNVVLDAATMKIVPHTAQLENLMQSGSSALSVLKMLNGFNKDVTYQVKNPSTGEVMTMDPRQPNQLLNAASTPISIDELNGISEDLSASYAVNPNSTSRAYADAIDAQDGPIYQTAADIDADARASAQDGVIQLTYHTSAGKTIQTKLDPSDKSLGQMSLLTKYQDLQQVQTLNNLESGYESALTKVAEVQHFITAEQKSVDTLTQQIQGTEFQLASTKESGNPDQAVEIQDNLEKLQAELKTVQDQLAKNTQTLGDTQSLADQEEQWLVQLFGMMSPSAIQDFVESYTRSHPKNNPFLSLLGANAAGVQNGLSGALISLRQMINSAVDQAFQSTPSDALMSSVIPAAVFGGGSGLAAAAMLLFLAGTPVGWAIVAGVAVGTAATYAVYQTEGSQTLTQAKSMAQTANTNWVLGNANDNKTQSQLQDAANKAGAYYQELQQLGFKNGEIFKQVQSTVNAQNAIQKMMETVQGVLKQIDAIKSGQQPVGTLGAVANQLLNEGEKTSHLTINQIKDLVAARGLYASQVLYNHTDFSHALTGGLTGTWDSLYTDPNKKFVQNFTSSMGLTSDNTAGLNDFFNGNGIDKSYVMQQNQAAQLLSNATDNLRGYNYEMVTLAAEGNIDAQHYVDENIGRYARNADGSLQMYDTQQMSYQQLQAEWMTAEKNIFIQQQNNDCLVLGCAMQNMSDVTMTATAKTYSDAYQHDIQSSNLSLLLSGAVGKAVDLGDTLFTAQGRDQLESDIVNHPANTLAAVGGAVAGAGLTIFASPVVAIVGAVGVVTGVGYGAYEGNFYSGMPGAIGIEDSAMSALRSGFSGALITAPLGDVANSVEVAGSISKWLSGATDGLTILRRSEEIVDAFNYESWFNSIKTGIQESAGISGSLYTKIQAGYDVLASAGGSLLTVGAAGAIVGGAKVLGFASTAYNALGNVTQAIKNSTWFANVDEAFSPLVKAVTYPGRLTSEYTNLLVRPSLSLYGLQTAEDGSLTGDGLLKAVTRPNQLVWGTLADATKDATGLGTIVHFLATVNKTVGDIRAFGALGELVGNGLSRSLKTLDLPISATARAITVEAGSTVINQIPMFGFYRDQIGNFGAMMQTGQIAPFVSGLSSLVLGVAGAKSGFGFEYKAPEVAGVDSSSDWYQTPSNSTLLAQQKAGSSAIWDVLKETVKMSGLAVVGNLIPGSATAVALAGAAGEPIFEVVHQANNTLQQQQIATALSVGDLVKQGSQDAALQPDPQTVERAVDTVSRLIKMGDDGSVYIGENKASDAQLENPVLRAALDLRDQQNASKSSELNLQATASETASDPMSFQNRGQELESSLNAANKALDSAQESGDAQAITEAAANAKNAAEMLALHYRELSLYYSLPGGNKAESADAGGVAKAHAAYATALGKYSSDIAEGKLSDANQLDATARLKSTDAQLALLRSGENSKTYLNAAIDAQNALENAAVTKGADTASSNDALSKVYVAQAAFHRAQADAAQARLNVQNGDSSNEAAQAVQTAQSKILDAKAGLDQAQTNLKQATLVANSEATTKAQSDIQARVQAVNDFEQKVAAKIAEPATAAGKLARADVLAGEAKKIASGKAADSVDQINAKIVAHTKAVESYVEESGQNVESLDLGSVDLSVELSKIRSGLEEQAVIADNNARLAELALKAFEANASPDISATHGIMDSVSDLAAQWIASTPLGKLFEGGEDALTLSDVLTGQDSDSRKGSSLTFAEKVESIRLERQANFEQDRVTKETGIKEIRADRDRLASQIQEARRNNLDQVNVDGLGKVKLATAENILRAQSLLVERGARALDQLDLAKAGKIIDAKSSFKDFYKAQEGLRDDGVEGAYKEMLHQEAQAALVGGKDLKSRKAAQLAAEKFSKEVKKLADSEDENGYRKAVEKAQETQPDWYQNDSLRAEVIEKVFGTKGPLNEAQALAFTDLLIRDLTGSKGLQLDQLRMIVQNLHGNIGTLAMGGGKTFVYTAVFAVRALMGDDVQGHLIVSDAQEVKKFVDPNGKYRKIMEAAGLRVSDGSDAYQKGKADGQAQLKAEFKSSDKKVIVFGLSDYGHLAREVKEDPTLRTLRDRVNMIGVDEADVGALLQQSFNVGRPKDATLELKQDVMELNQLLATMNSGTKVSFEANPSVFSRLQDDPHYFAYTYSPEGGIVPSKAVYDAAEGRFTAGQVREGLRGLYDLENGNVVMDKGELSKSGVGSGYQPGTRDQSDFYTVSAMIASHAGGLRTLDSTEQKTILDQTMALTTHGSEATVAEAFTQRAGKSLLVFGGSGTFDGAESIGEAVYGVSHVVAVQDVDFNSSEIDRVTGAQRLILGYDANIIYTDPETGNRFVLKIDSDGTYKPVVDQNGNPVNLERYLADRASDATSQGRGYLGIYESMGSLKSGMETYVRDQIDRLAGSETGEDNAHVQPYHDSALKELNQILEDTAKSQRASRVDVKMDKAPDEVSFLDRLQQSKNPLLKKIGMGMDVIDPFTASDKREGIAESTSSNKKAVFAVELAGRALNFAGENNLGVLNAEKYDKGTLLQMLGRVGRTMSDGSGRYDSHRDVFIDLGQLQGNAERFGRINEWLKGQSGYDSLKADFSKIENLANFKAPTIEDLKNGTVRLSKDDLSNALEANSQFKLFEKRSAATSFRLSSEVVTKLAKEPLGLEQSAAVGTSDFKVLSQSYDKLRSSGYDNSRSTYREGDFKSPRDRAREMVNGSLDQASQMWEDIANNEKASDALRARAAMRVLDLRKTQATLDSSFATKTTSDVKAFAEISPSDLQIGQKVVSVARSLADDLLPSESGVSVQGNSAAIVSSRRITDQMRTGGVDAPSDAEISNAAFMARQAYRLNPTMAKVSPQLAALAVIPANQISEMRALYASQVGDRVLNSANISTNGWNPIGDVKTYVQNAALVYNQTRAMGAGKVASFFGMRQQLSGDLLPTEQVQLAQSLLTQKPESSSLQRAVYLQASASPNAFLATVSGSQSKNPNVQAVVDQAMNLAINTSGKKFESGDGYSLTTQVVKGQVLKVLTVTHPTASAALRAMALAKESEMLQTRVRIELPDGDSERLNGYHTLEENSNQAGAHVEVTAMSFGSKLKALTPTALAGKMVSVLNHGQGRSPIDVMANAISDLEEHASEEKINISLNLLHAVVGQLDRSVQLGLLSQQRLGADVVALLKNLSEASKTEGLAGERKVLEDYLHITREKGKATIKGIRLDTQAVYLPATITPTPAAVSYVKNVFVEAKKIKEISGWAVSAEQAFEAAMQADNAPQSIHDVLDLGRTIALRTRARDLTKAQSEMINKVINKGFPKPVPSAKNQKSSKKQKDSFGEVVQSIRASFLSDVRQQILGESNALPSSAVLVVANTTSANTLGELEVFVSTLKGYHVMTEADYDQTMKRLKEARNAAATSSVQAMLPTLKTEAPSVTFGAAFQAALAQIRDGVKINMGSLLPKRSPVSGVTPLDTGFFSIRLATVAGLTALMVAYQYLSAHGFVPDFVSLLSSGPSMTDSHSTIQVASLFGFPFFHAKTRQWISSRAQALAAVLRAA